MKLINQSKLFLVLLAMAAVVFNGCKKDELKSVNTETKPKFIMLDEIVEEYDGNEYIVNTGSGTTFKLLEETVFDIDGNEYHTVAIGNQIWMVENLRVTRFRNGESISNDASAWLSYAPAYCWYNHDIYYKDLYGAYYNFAVATDSRCVAPEGWRVPTDDDWTALKNNLGGLYVAGGKMKSTGTNLWASPNTGATNESEFTALPAGAFDYNDNLFIELNYHAVFWSSTISDEPNYGLGCDLHYNSVIAYRLTASKEGGLSIRCIKGGTPIVITSSVTSISTNSATCGGNVTSDGGGGTVTARGVCWSTTANPTIANTKTTDGSGTGSFVSIITGLSPGTTYHVRAYATNSIGTSYGADVSFITLPASSPTVITLSIRQIKANTATGGGKVISDGGASLMERGVCWSTTANPTIADSRTVNGPIVIGSFISYLTELLPNTTYHVRAYATNSTGTTSYGDDIPFTTSSIPIVYTGNALNYGQTSATIEGGVSDQGAAPVTECGFCFSTDSDPDIYDNKVICELRGFLINGNLTGLTPATRYYFRAYATNSYGTAYGVVRYFDTLP